MTDSLHLTDTNDTRSLAVAAATAVEDVGTSGGVVVVMRSAAANAVTRAKGTAFGDEVVKEPTSSTHDLAQFLESRLMTHLFCIRLVVQQSTT